MNANPVFTAGLRLHTTVTADATVIRCSGRLTSEVTDVLKSEAKPLLVRDQCVVLDLTDLKFMDSAGLGAIVSLYVSAKTHGAKLQLINMNKQVKNLLGITNVLAAFESCGKFMTKMP